jgi:hypothetical protein
MRIFTYLAYHAVAGNVNLARKKIAAVDVFALVGIRLTFTCTGMFAERGRIVSVVGVPLSSFQERNKNLLQTR